MDTSSLAIKQCMNVMNDKLANIRPVEYNTSYMIYCFKRYENELYDS